MTWADRAERYARAVVAGEVEVCSLVQKACQRHLDDLERQENEGFLYYFDSDAANKVGRFIELMPHIKGRWARERLRLKLEDWQCFMVAVPFGWKRKVDDLRRFRRVYVEVPRKNAKSTVTAALGNYMFASDGEHGAEVYSGAGSEKQAWEVFGSARLMASKTEQFKNAFGVKVGAKNLHIPKLAAKFEPIIGNPGDGASPSFSITDEYHEHATSNQYDTMVTGMGSRDQPMAWVITTAGSDIQGPCYDLRQEVVDVLEGSVENPELFGLVYTIDEEDDWTSEEALRKANPNMGVSVREDYLRSQQRDAINNARKQSTFKTKHLNVWVTAASPYFNIESWNRLADPLLWPEDFAGQPCWLGLDLASKLDLCAKLKVFRRDLEGPCLRCDATGVSMEAVEGADGEEELVERVCPRCEGLKVATEPHLYAFGRYYLPKVQSEDAERKHYQAWAEQGYIHLTPGNITDYDLIEEHVVEDSERHRIVTLAVDPYNATQISTHMQDEGIALEEVPQTVAHLSEPMKWTQALIESGRLHHDGNPVLAWALGNVTAQEDRNGNVFPRKERPQNKIDPAVALIMAVGKALAGEPEPQEPSIFALGS